MTPSSLSSAGGKQVNPSEAPPPAARQPQFDWLLQCDKKVYLEVAHLHIDTRLYVNTDLITETSRSRARTIHIVFSQAVGKNILSN